MVKVREITRDTASAEWLEVVMGRLTQTERERVTHADLRAQEYYGDSLHPAGTRWIGHVRAAVGILSAPRVDGEAIAATLLLGVPRSQRQDRVHSGSGGLAATQAPARAGRGRSRRGVGAAPIRSLNGIILSARIRPSLGA